MGVGVFYSDLEDKGLGAGFGIHCDLDRRDQFESEEICESIAMAIDEIGGEGDTHSGRRRRTAFDKDMLPIGEGWHYAVGFMGWQHDYVVQVGGTDQVHEYLSDIEWHDRSIRDAYGMTPERFQKTMAEIFTRLNRYLMLTVMLDTGLQCHRLSGGYQSTLYVRPSDAMLKAEIKRLRTWLQRRHRCLVPAPARKAA